VGSTKHLSITGFSNCTHSSASLCRQNSFPEPTKIIPTTLTSNEALNLIQESRLELHQSNQHSISTANHDIRPKTYTYTTILIMGPRQAIQRIPEATQSLTESKTAHDLARKGQKTAKSRSLSKNHCPEALNKRRFFHLESDL
jgi:hypothetical protein